MVVPLISYLRTLLSRGIKGAPHNAPLGPFHTSFHKFLIDGFFHKDARACGAALALVEEHPLVSLLHGIVHYERKHRVLNTAWPVAWPAQAATFPSSQRPGREALLVTAYASE